MCIRDSYSTGTLKDRELERMIQEIKAMSGTLKVKSFPKFANQVSTIDIKNGIAEYKKIYGISPDVVIIDSMDLLTDSSGRRWSENGERHKRVAVEMCIRDRNINRIVQDWALTHTLNGTPLIKGKKLIGNPLRVTVIENDLKNYVTRILERVYKYHIAFKTMLYDQMCIRDSFMIILIQHLLILL